jgi:hypothetical protein
MITFGPLQQKKQRDKRPQKAKKSKKEPPWGYSSVHLEIKPGEVVRKIGLLLLRVFIGYKKVFPL